MKLPSHGVDNDGSGVDKVLVKEHLPVGSVQRWHFDGVRARVSPEHITSNPVDRNALWRVQTWREVSVHS